MRRIKTEEQKARARESGRKSYQKHHEKILAKHAAYRETHREELRASGRNYSRSHYAVVHVGERLIQRSQNWNARVLVLLHYGGECACCHEMTVYFLSVDHINGGGAKHFKQINRWGSMFYKYLIQQNMPDGYRVLCMNCNFCLGHYGFCPHIGHDTRVLSYRAQWGWTLKLEIIDQYGPVCACCDESNPYFLQLDHPKGDGAQHRKTLKKEGNGFYSYLRQHGFPKGYRILCVNCNFCRGCFGFCPHEGRGKQLDLL